MIELRQTYKDRVCARWHIVWEDTITRASFVYVGEKLDPPQAKARLLRLLRSESWTPYEVYWVWKQLDAMG